MQCVDLGGRRIIHKKIDAVHYILKVESDANTEPRGINNITTYLARGHAHAYESTSV